MYYVAVLLPRYAHKLRVKNALRLVDSWRVVYEILRAEMPLEELDKLRLVLII